MDSLLQGRLGGKLPLDRTLSGCALEAKNAAEHPLYRSMEVRFLSPSGAQSANGLVLEGHVTAEGIFVISCRSRSCG